MIRLFVVEDQKIISAILKEYLERETDICVTGTARGIREALRKIDGDVDIITLDVELEDGTGLEFLKKFDRKNEIPVIMLSSYTVSNADITLEALSAGAFDFVAKADGTDDDFLRMISEIKVKIRAAYNRNNSGTTGHLDTAATIAGSYAPYDLAEVEGYSLVGIGASTGGVQAIEHIFRNLRGKIPPVVIVQHLPVVFTRLLSERLNQQYSYNFVEVIREEVLLDNHVYIATGDHHLEVFCSGGKLFAQATLREKISGHRPSADVLFHSIALSCVAGSSLGIILTGMGRDGANGLLAMKEAGSFNIGQSEKTCAVYGMPQAAFKAGALHEQHDLEKIPEMITRCNTKKKEVNKNEKTTDC